MIINCITAVNKPFPDRHAQDEVRNANKSKRDNNIKDEDYSPHANTEFCG